jgi:hemolysin activation/secretion protein
MMQGTKAIRQQEEWLPALRVLARAALAAAAFGGSVASAQPVDSGALMRQQQQSAPPERSGPKPAPAPKLEVRKPAAEAAQPQAAVRVFVKRFKLSSASTLLNDQQLNERLAGFLERENTLEELRQAAEQISSDLRERGYVFARAFLPQQELLDGTVLVAIAEGRLSTEEDGKPSIQVKRGSSGRLNEARARSILAGAISDPAGLNVRDIERGLLLLNDIPGVQGSGIVVPGREPGTAGLAVEVREGPLLDGWIGYDNFGSRSTGRDRLTGEGRFNNPSGRGDLGELHLARSPGTESGTLSYILPVGVSGFRARVAGSGMRYEVRSGGAPAEGSSAWLSAGGSYPLQRSQSASTYVTATWDGRRFNDRVADVATSSRRTTSFSTGLQGSRYYARSGRGLSYSASLTRGSLDRSAVASDLAADEATRRTHGGYGVVRATGAWLEPLGRRFSLSGTYAMQAASRNLDSSEKLYLGGPRGVRAYPTEEAGSDSGHILNLEVRWRAFQAGRHGEQEWTLYSFFDAGHATLNKSVWTGWNAGNPGLRNKYALKGWGMGLRVDMSQTVKVDVVRAAKIGHNPGASATGLDADGRSDRIRFWVVGTVFF